MTRKDYIKLADAIAEARITAIVSQPDDEQVGAGIHRGVGLVKMEIIKALRLDNPRFDVDRFNTHIEKRVAKYSK